MSIITLILTAIGAPVFANGIALLVNQSGNVGTYLTILLGAALIIIGLCFKLIKKLFLYPLFKLLSTLVCFACVLVLIVSTFLCIYGNANTATYNEDYLIVLGCGIKGSEPSELLKLRLDKALEYNERNPDCKIIVTGGQGKNEIMPEADVMQKYLIDKGIESERILKETQSTSTNENFIFSNNITNGALDTSEKVFITNDFHIYRANSLAKMNGLSLNHLCAQTTFYTVIPSYLRENLALLQMLFFNK